MSQHNRKASQPDHWNEYGFYVVSLSVVRRQESGWQKLYKWRRLRTDPKVTGSLISPVYPVCISLINVILICE